MLSSERFPLFSKEVQDSLKSIEGKYGLKFHLGEISQMNSRLTMHLIAVKNDLAAKPFEQLEFERDAFRFGFTKEDYGKRFNINGERWRLVGVKASTSGRQVIIESIEGKRYEVPLGFLSEGGDNDA